ncbi:type II secretion system F family protein [Pseudodesulfovibrio sp. zrk46]|uniref:type II secretion system F family protein n=1 Tax=Pseudodesulfovibrio sp. zrk46 TaxID=2725288 RepID=UPI00144A2CD2|nr:type II secretion system F family protein [Pseudodesulfovibrio sp. zrk46]QJB55242.1 type II secretion system F family protein [Pseudodesulfovibrio sp. zrk46]
MNPELFPYIAAALAFGSVLLAGYGIIGYIGGAGQSARLKERVSGTPAPSATGALFDDLRKKLGSVFENLGSKIGPKDEKEADKNRKALIQAGLRTHTAVKKFQGVKGILALLLAGGFLAARFLILTDLSMVLTMLGTVAMASVGVYGPEIWLRKRITNRQLAVANELPDALDLLVVCVESGMGLDQAIERVQDELKLSGPIISSELKLLTLELRAGKARSEALRALSDRVGQDDLSSLTSLLVQADVFGISVGRTLRVYSDSMRTKRSQRAEEKAAKLPVLLLLPLVVFILPSLFIAIMGPSVMIFIDVFGRMGQ